MELRLKLEWLERELQNLENQLSAKDDIEKGNVTGYGSPCSCSDKEKAAREQLAELNRENRKGKRKREGRELPGCNKQGKTRRLIH